MFAMKNEVKQIPELTVPQESQCARFRRVFTCSPIIYIHKTRYNLPGFVIAAMILLYP